MSFEDVFLKMPEEYIQLANMALDKYKKAEQMEAEKAWRRRRR